jgi:hypothetical protein
MKWISKHRNELKNVNLVNQSSYLIKNYLRIKTTKLFFGLALVATLFTSCYTEVIVADNHGDPIPAITLAELVGSYELWYVDIERTTGNGNIPFLQKAFTVSFRNGKIFANNNLVGFGSQGNGFGIDVGYYDTYGNTLEVDHDIDGFYSFKVTQLNDFEIELFFPQQNISYVLEGYQRNTFDYDTVFYRNIHYFLQEYDAWEKTFTSEYGNLNEFDYENYLAFIPGGGDGNFQSSQDQNGIHPYDLYWDYTGIYNVDDVSGTERLKYLTLDYDYLGNEYFELSVVNDQTIELFHSDSGTLYEFTGRGYIQYRTASEGKLRKTKKDIAKTMKKISQF